MKKYSIFIIILLLLFGLGLMLIIGGVNDDLSEAVSEENELENNLNPFTLPETGDDLVGVDLNVPGDGQSIVLTKGVLDFDLTEIEGGGTVAYLSYHTIKVTDGDKTYFVAPVAVNTGGTGNFLYLILYEKTETGFIQLDNELLGDRIALKSLVIDETYSAKKVLATILERGPNEPFSVEPTIERITAFELKDGQLIVTTYYGN